MKNIFSLFSNQNKTISPANNAKKSCLLSLYGDNAPMDDNKRLYKFYQSIDDTISYKCSLGEFNCTRQIPNDLIKYKDDIINCYQESGFNCIEINQKIKELNNNVILIDWSNKYNYE